MAGFGGRLAVGREASGREGTKGPTTVRKGGFLTEPRLWPDTRNLPGESAPRGESQVRKSPAMRNAIAKNSQGGSREPGNSFGEWVPLRDTGRLGESGRLTGKTGTK
jgi:hypothetical protein